MYLILFEYVAATVLFIWWFFFNGWNILLFFSGFFLSLALFFNMIYGSRF